MTRVGTRVKCPGCGREVVAYVPSQGDGSALRLPMHRQRPSRGATVPACPEGGNYVSPSKTTPGEWEAW